MIAMTIKLNDGNMQNIEAIQRVIIIEEGAEASVDDVLKRVLDFYAKYVPYK